MIRSCFFLRAWFILIIINLFSFSRSREVSDDNLNLSNLDSEERKVIELASADDDDDSVIMIKIDRDEICFKNEWDKRINIEIFLSKLDEKMLRRQKKINS